LHQILKDDNPPNPDVLNLPSGDYDIPLMIASKQFQANGKLVSPESERVSLYGDVITVNGQPWPYVNVEARKYKFRLLDASISRSYNLYLVADEDPTTKLGFTVVGADAGYLSHPVPTQNVIIAMAERYEIVIDFDKYEGKNLTLMNERNFQTNEDYPATDKVLRFVVGKKLSSDGNGEIPSALGVLNMPGEHTTIDHSFTFERTNGQWLINGVGFEDIPNRILAFPKQGKVERWELINKSGGWSHPIHIHLIDFQVVKRSGGRGVVEPYEAAALKDVVYLGMNERVELVANYAPWSGGISPKFKKRKSGGLTAIVYMFHCHNLVHEDHDMMAAFNVSQIDLTDFGYPQNVSFIDPMTTQFQAKKCSDYLGACPSGDTKIDLTKIKSEILPGFAGTHAYPDSDKFEQAEEAYYSSFSLGVSTVSSKSTAKSSTSVSSTTLRSSTVATTSKVSTTSVPTTLSTSTSKATSTSSKSSGKGS
jgi:bilirubin oxidase